MNTKALTRALVVALVQHQGATLPSFNTDSGLKAALGPKHQATFDVHGGTFVAIPQDYAFPAPAHFLGAKQVDGNTAPVKFGWSDTPTADGVRHWYETNAAQAGLYGYDKGNDDGSKPGGIDTRYDEQLSGNQKWLILTPIDPAFAGVAKFELVLNGAQG